MATLTRPRDESVPNKTESEIRDLTANIPTPFPALQITQRHSLDQESQASPQSDTYHSAEEDVQVVTSTEALPEILPSIASLQKSCLMTLNNLLSVQPDHSAGFSQRPHSAPGGSSAEAETAQSPPLLATLDTLVQNLRNRDPEPDMIQLHGNTEADRLHELRMRVETLSSTLDPRDAQLALTLVSLLAKFHRLSHLHSTSPLFTAPPEFSSADATEAQSHADVLATLERQLNHLQTERQSHPALDSPPGLPPVSSVERALLWSHIDEDLDSVMLMCKTRADTLPRATSALSHSLPPKYDPADFDDSELPPEYRDSRASIDVKSSKAKSIMGAGSIGVPATAADEKMRMDLEAIATAIDRLYLVAPQLHNQRVELKTAKLKQMERAKLSNEHTSASSSKAAGKEKEKDDMQDLENMFDLLGKANSRTLSRQSVMLDANVERRFEKARQRDLENRSAFVEQLVAHSNTGRLHGQDAIQGAPRVKDPQALLTLPEFIREAVPREVSQRSQSKTLLTLPEFFRESIPEEFERSESRNKRPGHHKKRSRSSSGVSLTWLRSSSTRLGSREDTIRRPRSSRGSGSESTATVSNLAFDVRYIAENHESLQHVLVFVTLTGVDTGAKVEAEVLPCFPDINESERLLIRSGSRSSFPLRIPARTSPGKKDVQKQTGHYEIKLGTIPSPTPLMDMESTPLLDATKLSNMKPTSCVCAYCSLPLIRSSQIHAYQDLPSEHWQELVDAWMCHTDQTLHEQVAKHGRGFWPEQGKALVGGSYILFEESSVVRNNVTINEEAKRGEDWRLVRCLCGATIGRCQENQSPDGPLSTVFRLVKYAIRPISQTSEYAKVPLSAFIVEDMTEFVQAHATYRFVIMDEEEERPRLLIWLFKPNMKLSYSIPVSYAIPKSGSIQAAKVLYRIIGPSGAAEDLKSLLNKYPGFPQAEYLFYPMNICRQLASLLKESNTSYPENMQVMTGLDVGWLQRA